MGVRGVGNKSAGVGIHADKRTASDRSRRIWYRLGDDGCGDLSRGARGGHQKMLVHGHGAGLQGLTIGGDMRRGFRNRSKVCKPLVILIIGTVGTALATAPAAVANGGGATIHTLPESSKVEVNASVEYECPFDNSECSWYGQAAAYNAETECPNTWDLSHGVGIGSVDQGSGSDSWHFAFLPSEYGSTIKLCLYIDGEEDSCRRIASFRSSDRSRSASSSRQHRPQDIRQRLRYG